MDSTNKPILSVTTNTAGSAGVKCFKKSFFMMKSFLVNLSTSGKEISYLIYFSQGYPFGVVEDCIFSNAGNSLLLIQIIRLNGGSMFVKDSYFNNLAYESGSTFASMNFFFIFYFILFFYFYFFFFLFIYFFFFILFFLLFLFLWMYFL
jgi:hypothetical protein